MATVRGPSAPSPPSRWLRRRYAGRELPSWLGNWRPCRYLALLRFGTLAWSPRTWLRRSRAGVSALGFFAWSFPAGTAVLLLRNSTAGTFLASSQAPSLFATDASTFGDVLRAGGGRWPRFASGLPRFRPVAAGASPLASCRVRRARPLVFKWLRAWRLSPRLPIPRTSLRGRTTSSSGRETRRTPSWPCLKRLRLSHLHGARSRSAGRRSPPT